MKTRALQILPWTIPLLVLVFVLSGCGKDGKIVHDLSLNPVKDIKKVTQGVHSTHTDGSQELNPQDFASRCANDLKGGLENNGTGCAYPALPKPVVMNAAEPGEQVITPNLEKGQFITVTGNATSDIADIRLNGAKLMDIVDGRKLVSTDGGALTFFVKNKSQMNATLTIWNCANNVWTADQKPTRVFCNENILK
ncbi:MAG: hypothetical protein ACXVB9_12915 [Bdellovibrionota bacterium]